MSDSIQPSQINSYLTKKIIQDLVIECNSSTQVVIKSGSTAGADDGSVVMEAPSDRTLDITTSGKNGLDTGAEAADTWYYVWMIWNPSTAEVAGLLSASATSPTLPSGFTKKRLVGAVRNDGSSDFKQFLQKNQLVRFEDGYLVYSATPTVDTWLSLDLSSYVPSSFSDEFIFWLTGQGASADSFLRSLWGSRSGAGTGGHLLLDVDGDTSRQDDGIFYEFHSGGYWSFYRANFTNGVTIRVSGYTLNL